MFGGHINFQAITKGQATFKLFEQVDHLAKKTCKEWYREDGFTLASTVGSVLPIPDLRRLRTQIIPLVLSPVPHRLRCSSLPCSLDCGVWATGYAKDSSSVARDAMKHAADEGYECVLIDTAGRMQASEGHEPLGESPCFVRSNGSQSVVIVCRRPDYLDHLVARLESRLD